MQNLILKCVVRWKTSIEPAILYLQAETSKKMLSSKEELQFNISELSGTIVKQGYLVKQVNTVFEDHWEARKEQLVQLSGEGMCYMSMAIGLCPAEYILPAIAKWGVFGYKHTSYEACCSGRINWIFHTCWVYSERHKTTTKSFTQTPPELLQSHQVSGSTVPLV